MVDKIPLQSRQVGCSGPGQMQLLECVLAESGRSRDMPRFRLLWILPTVSSASTSGKQQLGRKHPESVLLLQVFMLSADTQLDEEMLDTIVNAEHTRVPVYEGERCDLPDPVWTPHGVRLQAKPVLMSGRKSMRCCQNTWKGSKGLSTSAVT